MYYSQSNFSYIGKVDKKYFKVIFVGYCLVVRSINTGHYWSIKQNEFGTFVLDHKHKEGQLWHFQKKSREYSELIAEIKAHDNYQLGGRKEKAIFSRACETTNI